MKEKLEEVHVSFMRNLVKESSIFFYNLHQFCEKYEKKLIGGGGRTDQGQRKKVQKKPNSYLNFFQ